MKFQDISDYKKMGELIQKWSDNQALIPKDMQEFRDLLKVLGITAEITETKFIAMPYGQDTLIIKIPLPPLLSRLHSAGSWMLPEIYDKAYSETSQRKPATDPDSATLNLERLGDYSITNCGEG